MYCLGMKLKWIHQMDPSIELRTDSNQSQFRVVVLVTL